ncbi:MAG: hypothetical protein EBR54_06055 [Flavobacteriia bacterium]|nr:hypothetical protein [Flavobacteriia bacterium]
MIVHLIRASDFSALTYQSVLHLLNQFPGPITYRPSETEVEINDAVEREVSNEADFKTAEEKEPLVNNSAIDSTPWYNFSQREPVIFPRRTRTASWDSLIEICKAYRKNKHLPNADLVILLTDTANDANWFVGGDEAMKNAFIHTADWHYYFEGLNERFPISYEIAASVLRMAACETFSEFRRLWHKEPRGCISDLCMNKSQIVMKMKTADICSDCMNHFSKQDLDIRLVSQVVETFEGIRKNFLTTERSAFLRRPSRLLVKGYMHQLLLMDYGNISLPLNPKQRALYCFFLNHPEGVKLVDLVDHEAEIKELYHRFSNQGDRERIDDSLHLLLDPLDGNLHETLSRIRRIVVKAVGSRMAGTYQISGNRGEPFKISLPHEFIVFENVNLY